MVLLLSERFFGEAIMVLLCYSITAKKKLYFSECKACACVMLIWRALREGGDICQGFDDLACVCVCVCVCPWPVYLLEVRPTAELLTYCSYLKICNGFSVCKGIIEVNGAECVFYLWEGKSNYLFCVLQCEWAQINKNLHGVCLRTSRSLYLPDTSHYW